MTFAVTFALAMVLAVVLAMSLVILAPEIRTVLTFSCATRPLRVGVVPPLTAHMPECHATPVSILTRSARLSPTMLIPVAPSHCRATVSQNDNRQQCCHSLMHVLYPFHSNVIDKTRYHFNCTPGFAALLFFHFKSIGNIEIGQKQAFHLSAISRLRSLNLSVALPGSGNTY